MFRILAAAAMVFTCAAAGAHGASAGFDPLSLYGPELRFQITRNGVPSGDHTVKFRREDGVLSAESRFKISVYLLFLNVYSMDYLSHSVWRNGAMTRLDVRTEENGDAVTVKAEAAPGGGLTISGPSGAFESDRPLYPTDHWNPGVLGSEQVINTINGKIADVAITPGGREILETPHGPVEAVRYDYTGDFKTSVWYAGDGRWVRMRFKAKDGSDIDYQCVKCAGPGAGGAE